MVSGANVSKNSMVLSKNVQILLTPFDYFIFFYNGYWKPPHKYHHKICDVCFFLQMSLKVFGNGNGGLITGIASSSANLVIIVNRDHVCRNIEITQFILHIQCLFYFLSYVMLLYKSTYNDHEIDVTQILI